MSVKLSTLPLLTSRSSGLCSSSSLDVSTSRPNFGATKWDPSCGVRTPHLQTNTTRARSSSLTSGLERWKLHSLDQTQPVVLDEEKKTWVDCIQKLTALNFSSEEADFMLKRSFGWIDSPYWSEERQKEVPKAEKVHEVLEYLKSLGLSSEDLQKICKKFPEVLGCSLDEEMKTNVVVLEREWGIKGKTLRNLLLT